MQTLTLWNGHATPRVARGETQCRLAEFAMENRCWHFSPHRDGTAKHALQRLEQHGFLELETNPTGLYYRYRA